MVKISSHTFIFNKRNNKKFSCHSVDKRIIFHSKKYYNLNLIYKKLLENIKEISFSVNCHYLFFFLFCILVVQLYVYTFAISIRSCKVGYFRHLDTFIWNKILSEARPILPDFCRPIRFGNSVISQIRAFLNWNLILRKSVIDNHILVQVNLIEVNNSLLKYNM